VGSIGPFNRAFRQRFGWVRLGYLPREAMTTIAAYLKIPAIDVYGVVTFYNQFRLNPPGRHSIRVCLGTACHMKGGTSR
jgi:NADH-quinone oxidoreductase subunit E